MKKHFITLAFLAVMGFVSCISQGALAYSNATCKSSTGTDYFQCCQISNYPVCWAAKGQCVSAGGESLELSSSCTSKSVFCNGGGGVSPSDYGSACTYSGS